MQYCFLFLRRFYFIKIIFFFLVMPFFVSNYSVEIVHTRSTFVWYIVVDLFAVVSDERLVQLALVGALDQTRPV